MSNFGNTGFCGCGGCGCSACQPANTIYQRTCTDPGVVNSGAALSVLDNNFCERRMANPASNSFVVIYLTPQGYQVSATNAPQVTLDAFAGVSGSTIGNLVVEGSDNVLRQLTLPAVAGLYLSTNASGQLVVGPLPNQPIPDPLSVTNLNATNATIGTLTVTGQIKAANMATGTVANIVGLDASGNIVKGAPAATGVQGMMFYEAPVSPSNTYPNSGVVAGGILTIGNIISDSTGVSGGGLITVTTGQLLTVVTPGWYNLNWFGNVCWDGGAGHQGDPAILLLINGIIVNNGAARPTGASAAQRNAVTGGGEVRKLAAGDTIQLQLGSGAGVGVSVYEVRITALKFADP